MAHRLRGIAKGSSVSIEADAFLRLVGEAQVLLEKAEKAAQRALESCPTARGAALYGIKLGGVAAARRALETVA